MQLLTFYSGLHLDCDTLTCLCIATDVVDGLEEALVEVLWQIAFHLNVILPGKPNITIQLITPGATYDPAYKVPKHTLPHYHEEKEGEREGGRGQRV